MSRNKDIAYLHDLTGWDFKTCRLIMKKSSWDLQTVERAYILSQDEELRENIEKIFASVAEAAAKAFEALKPVIENTVEVLGKLAEDIKPVLEEAHQNMIEYQKPEVIGAAIDEEICRLDHCMLKPDSEGIDQSCETYQYIFGEDKPKCTECKHYGCEAFRKLKAEQERYEEE